MNRLHRSILVIAIFAFAAVPALAQVSDLAVGKNGPDVAPADTDVTYTVTLLNGGPDDAASVTLTDNIPAGMTFVSSIDDPEFSCVTPPVGSGGSIVCTDALMTAGDTATFTFVFHIPPATPPATFFTNIVTVTCPTDPNSENDTAIYTTSTPPPPQANMGVLKNGPSTAGPDTDVSYDITVVNAGPDDALSAELSDTLPGDMTFVSVTQNSGPSMPCTDPGVGNGGLVTCTTASLPSGSTANFTLVGHLPVTATGSYQNTATVSSETDDPSPENDSGTTSLTVSSVDVSIAKQGPPTATAGDTINYALQVDNSGPDTAVNVTLTDNLPPNTTFVSLTHDAGLAPLFCTTPPMGMNGTVTCSWSAFGALASSDLTLSIEIGNTTLVSNTASVSSDSFDTDLGNNSATANTTVTPLADIEVTKIGPATVAPGQDVTYTVTFTNNGPSDAANATLSDALPPNMTFVSASPAGCTTPAVGAPGTITCVIDPLPPNDPRVYTFVMHLDVSTPDGGMVTNTAMGSTTTTDSSSANDSDSTTATVTSSADVSVTKDGPATVAPGQDVTYTVTITNNGPSNAANATLTDTLPPNMTYVSASPAGCTTPAVGSPGTITCVIDPLPPNDPRVYTFVMHLDASTPDGGNVTNTATGSTTTTDSSSANDSDSTTATIASSADVSVAKSGPPTVAAGSNITYTVTVTNNGPSNASTVSLTDTLPPDTTFVSNTQTSGPAFLCNNPPVGGTGTITCDIAALNAGVSATFEFVFNVSPTATGTLSNTANVSSTTPDPTPLNGSSSAGTTIAPPGSADLEIEKTAEPGSFEPGDDVTFTILVTNNGPSDAFAVTVTDVLPAGSTLVSATPTQGSCTGTTTVTCNLGTVAASGTATITLILTLPATPGPTDNTAVVTAQNVDPDPSNNSSTATVSIAGTDIPSLSPLALALLAIVLGAIAFVALRTT